MTRRGVSLSSGSAREYARELRARGGDARGHPTHADALRDEVLGFVIASKFFLLIDLSLIRCTPRAFCTSVPIGQKLNRPSPDQ